MQNCNSKIKITFSTVLIAILFLACQNNKQAKEGVAMDLDEVTDEKIADGKRYTGEFIYTPEAAVFTSKSFIYGVKINDVAKELAEKVQTVKNDEYDIVPVTIQGEVSPKPQGQDGWDEIITITHIIDVSDTPKSPDVEFK